MSKFNKKKANRYDVDAPFPVVGDEPDYNDPYDEYDDYYDEWLDDDPWDEIYDHERPDPEAEAKEQALRDLEDLARRMRQED